MNKKTIPAIIILFILLILFYRPLFSNQPLGLDSLGHLSKVSYLKSYPFADWDMSWYSGTLFLKLYPPLFYYVVSLASNVFLATNLICFLSIFLTSLGIYLLVDNQTKNKIVSLFCGLGFLSVLSISYYWISTGNLPYFAALWTIPFSLYFLEKSIETNKNKYFIIYSLIFCIGILTHIVIGFLIGVLVILNFLFRKIDLKNFKRILLYCSVPVLLSCFWFIPFLIFSNPSGGYRGYVPRLIQLFGFKDQIAWGLYAGGMGVFAFLFIFSLFFFKKFSRDKKIIFYFVSIFLFGFLLLGGLGSNYPFGVDPVRFILPFSILSIIFVGLVINKSKIYKNKIILAGLFLVLFMGLIWNFIIINENFEKFSYYEEDGRYKIFQDIISYEEFPLKNEFNNYRFGTSKFIFGENLNYFMPNVPQTFGYQDAGMLNAPRYYDMRWHIWMLDEIDKAVYWLDWFGIKYFEAENKDFVDKFKEDARFRIVMNYSKDYDFTLFEYLDAKQIISLVDWINDTSFGEEKIFEWERKDPDRVVIKYDFVDDNDVILFKEFYHKTWKAKDMNSGENLKINKTPLGFMFVNPLPDSKGVVFYQSMTIEEYIGILFSLIGILILILGIQKNSPTRIRTWVTGSKDLYT